MVGVHLVVSPRGTVEVKLLTNILCVVGADDLIMVRGSCNSYLKVSSIEFSKLKLL